MTMVLARTTLVPLENVVVAGTIEARKFSIAKIGGTAGSMLKRL
jgi:hypothetical protein